MIEFIVRHKFGIIGTILFHIILLVYFNTSKITVPPYERKTSALIEFDYREDEKDIEELEKEIEELEKQVTDEQMYEQIQNLMRDKNYVPKSQSSNNQSTNQSVKSIEEELAQKYKDLEQQIIDSREAEGKHFKAPEKKVDKSTTPKSNENGKDNGESSQPTGKVITECDIPGRRCFAKTPAYRCPAGGKIHVDIKVNQKGEVVSADVNESLSTSTNTCIVNEALKYAKRSTANQDFTVPSTMEGSIVYIFVSQ